jgi:microcystin degradation protein MlrC
MKKARIATGGFIHETNTFSPIPTHYESFRVIRGQTLVRERLGGETAKEIDLVPTLFAESLPSGLVCRAAYERIKGELLEAFASALPLDGIHLDLHGAMEVEGIGDAEGDFASAVRNLAGPDTLISVSLDLHGNISPALVNAANVLTAYRTAPHRDMLETRRRALSHLIRSLRSHLSPVSVLVKLPLILTGEAAVTEVEPARLLYSRLSAIERIPGLMDASLVTGCPWTDSEHTSVSAIAVAERDRELAERHVLTFSRQVWEKRSEFRLWGEAAPVDEAIRRAMDSQKHPVFLTDSGDNITAGAAGDIPLLAERLLAMGARDALVAGVTDPDAVRRCAEAGEGTRVDLAIGGKLDRVNGQPLVVRGVVEHLTREKEGEGEKAVMALLRVEGVRVLLVVDRRFLIDRAGIAAGGADPMNQKIVVVKQGYLFPDLYDHAPRAIMALSPGATVLELERLSYRKVRRPVYPLERDCVWPVSP